MISRLILVLSLLTIFISACGSAETLIYTEVPQDLLAQEQQIVQDAAMATLTAQGPQQQESSPSATPEEAVVEEDTPASGPVEESPTDIPPTAPVVDANTNRPPLGFAPGSSNFRASSPATVNLASGDVQLVEFFAEW